MTAHKEPDRTTPSLTALVPTYLPQIPQDPYIAQPLHYDPANRKIWCVGQNLTNGGGNSSPNPSFDYLDPTIQIPVPAPPQ